MSSSVFGETFDCIVPVPVPRSKKKIKLKLDCTHEDIIRINSIAPPKRTKKKLRDHDEVNLETILNDDEIKINYQEFTEVNGPKACGLENVINYEFMNDLDSKNNENKAVPLIQREKGPKIVKLIEKSSSELNETIITVNSDKVDINNVPKLKMNILNKVVGFGKIQRDSEDDSGVYCSDSNKVSPIKLKSDMDTAREIICYSKSENGRYIRVDDAFCINPNPDIHKNNNNNNVTNINCIINSDSVDNKNETNLGPLKQVDSSVFNPLVSVLDSFEAEILNTFKESTFNDRKFNSIEEKEKNFIGKSLSQYLEDILSVSENNEDRRLDIVEVSCEETQSKCSRYEVYDTAGSKVYEETGSETCNNIFQCVSSNSHHDLDSTINVDYSSTKLGFLINDCSSSDFLNTAGVIKDVSLTGIINYHESFTHEVDFSNSDNNSPVNVIEYGAYDNIASDSSYEHNISSDIDSNDEPERFIESPDEVTDERRPEEFLNKINDTVLVNNYKNNVKCLIHFFEGIVQDSTQPDNNYDETYNNLLMTNSNLNEFSFVKNIDENDQAFSEDIKPVIKKENTKNKAVKTVSFNDDIIIINDEENEVIKPLVDNSMLAINTDEIDNLSSASSEEIVDSHADFIYDRLTVSDDNSSELCSSFSSDEVIEDKRIEIIPLIDPPEEFKFVEILDNIIDNRNNDNIISIETDPTHYDDLWANRHDALDYCNEAALESYFSFIKQNYVQQNISSPSTEFSSFKDFDINSSITLNDFSGEEKKISNTFQQQKNLENNQGNGQKPKSPTIEFTSSEVDSKNEDEISSVDSNDKISYEVILEKVWGSVGIKLDVDLETGQLFISDLLTGGAADSSGLINIGTLNFLALNNVFYRFI